MSEHTDVEVAIEAAQAGAAVLRSRYGGPLTRYAKSESDFATEADLEAERAIRDVVRAARPDDAFVGEEGGLDGSDRAARTWLVDPLCGTLNFAAHTPLVAVNVALREGTDVSSRRVSAAAVADPFSHELWWTDGSGALKRRDGTDEPLAPTSVSRLVDVDFDDAAPWAASVIARPEFYSRFGLRVVSTSLALVWVADGRRAAYLQAGDLRDSVHFAAGIAVSRAAGCVVTGLRGQPVLSDDGGVLAAADAATHQELLALLDAAGHSPPT